MNILFSSDDNYARHLGVAIDSLLLHNIDVPKIRLFIIDNHISQLNIDKLESVVNSFKNSEIFYIPFESYVKKLSLNLAWPISLSSYARLFVGEMLPADVERVLYMDCDIVVKGSLLKLWNWNLGDNCLGAIQDTIPARTKASVGLSPTQPYFNAGVLLIDLKRWRQNKVGERCLAFIDSHAGRVSHHDQGVLNGVLMGQWARLPLKYNVMTVHYMMSQNKIRKFYKDDATFYDSKETEDAIKKPIILHFTPSFTVRPWEKNCSHPFRDDYKGLYLSLPWKDVPFSRSNDPWYVRLLNLRYRFFPI